MFRSHFQKQRASTAWLDRKDFVQSCVAVRQFQFSFVLSLARCTKNKMNFLEGKKKSSMKKRKRGIGFSFFFCYSFPSSNDAMRWAGRNVAILYLFYLAPVSISYHYFVSLLLWYIVYACIYSCFVYSKRIHTWRLLINAQDPGKQERLIILMNLQRQRSSISLPSFLSIWALVRYTRSRLSLDPSCLIYPRFCMYVRPAVHAIYTASPKKKILYVLWIKGCMPWFRSSTCNACVRADVNYSTIELQILAIISLGRPLPSRSKKNACHYSFNAFLSRRPKVRACRNRARLIWRRHHAYVSLHQ